jgi:hypothetical protein
MIIRKNSWHYKVVQLIANPEEQNPFTYWLHVVLSPILIPIMFGILLILLPILWPMACAISYVERHPIRFWNRLTKKVEIVEDEDEL